MAIIHQLVQLSLCLPLISFSRYHSKRQAPPLTWGGERNEIESKSVVTADVQTRKFQESTTHPFHYEANKEQERLRKDRSRREEFLKCVEMHSHRESDNCTDGIDGASSIVTIQYEDIVFVANETTQQRHTMIDRNIIWENDIRSLVRFSKSENQPCTRGHAKFINSSIKQITETMRSFFDRCFIDIIEKSRVSTGERVRMGNYGILQTYVEDLRQRMLKNNGTYMEIFTGTMIFLIVLSVLVTCFLTIWSDYKPINKLFFRCSLNDERDRYTSSATTTTFNQPTNITFDTTV